MNSQNKASKHDATPWMPTNDDMAGGFSAAKRVHVRKSAFLDDWWVGYGKNEACQIEGTPNHWFWLAYLMLGIVEESDSPYSGDKPLPFSPAYVRQCIADAPLLLRQRDMLLEAANGVLVASRLHGPDSMNAAFARKELRATIAACEKID